MELDRKEPEWREMPCEMRRSEDLASALVALPAQWARRWRNATLHWGSKFDPDGSVDQNHLRRFRFTGTSARISRRSPSQIPDPKKRGMLWIFRMRITSPSAVLTAAEYVRADRI